MAFLDFYLKDNGRVEFNRDLSITQYSNKVDTIRLLTKEKFDIVNMNVTLPNSINTTKKILLLQPNKADEYWVYSYPVDLSMTDIELGSDKANIRLSFFMYPDSTDQSRVNTTGMCYVTIIRNNNDNKPDGSVTESDLNTLSSEINSINEKLSNLSVGQIDTAKNYNTNTGTIKDKFDRLEASIGNNESDIKDIKQTLSSINVDGDLSDILSTVDTKVNQLNASNSAVLSKLGDVNSTVEDISTRVEDNSNEIDNIKNNILPSLQAGLKYKVVESLPSVSENGVIYLVKNSGDDYTEYIHLDTGWEVIGSSNGSVDLTGYYTSAEINTILQNYNTKTEDKNTFVTKSELSSAIPTKLSSFTNDEGYIKNEQGAFDYNNLSNTPDIPSKLSELENDASIVDIDRLSTVLSNYVTGTELNNVSSRITTNADNISNVKDNIKDIESTLSLNVETANKALEIANSKQFAKVFSTKSQMITYIQNEQDETVTVGTELLITDKDSPDYWISAIYSSRRDYTTSYGETFTNVYYGIEETEGKLDLSDYATLEYVNNTYDDKIRKYIDDADNTKVNLSAKSSEISSTSTDNEWSSAAAVYNYGNNIKNDLDNKISDNANKITVLNTNLESTNETVSEYKTELDATNTEQNTRLDTHDTTLVTLRNDLDDETSERVQADTTLQASITTLDNKVDGINSELNTKISNTKSELVSKIETTESTLTNALETYKEEADAKFLDYTETISKAESIVDYNSNDTLRFTTTSTEKDFTISEVDMDNLETMLSMFEPNEY